MCVIYFAASSISKNEIKDAREQNDSLCTRRVSHIDETNVCQYMQHCNLTNLALNWLIKDFVDSSRSVIDITFLTDVSYNYY